MAGNARTGQSLIQFLMIEGVVCSGFGRGAQFLTVAWVRRELAQKLNLQPFPGTLNLRVPPDIWSALYTRRNSFLKISDVSSAACPGYITRVTLRAHGRRHDSAYLIIPEMTSYRDVLEIIAAKNLREALGLKDRDTVQVEVIMGRSARADSTTGEPGSE